MSWRKEFCEYVNEYRTKEKSTLEALKTHTTEIRRMCIEGLSGFLTDEVTHFLPDSLRSEFLFADGKRYEIIIKELK